MQKIRFPYSLFLVLALCAVLGVLTAVIAGKSDISFNVSYETAILLIMGLSLAAGAVSFFMYRRSAQLLPTVPRYVLAAFRYLVLFAVALLLLDPRLETRTELSTPPTIAVIQDNSESIVINKDSAFVKNEYPAKLKALMDQLNASQAEVRFFSFASELNSQSDPDSLTYDQSGTNISTALQEVRKLYASQNLGATVLISDGISTSGINPLYNLEDVQQPIFTVMLGDTTPQKDISITEVLYNEIAYLENETPVKVKINSSGYENQKLRVSISSRGKVLATEDITVTDEQPASDVDFLVTPGQTGIVQYSIAVSTLPDEITTRNNFKSIFIKVLETKVKIGLFAGFPHPDIGALTQALSRDERYTVNSFVHKSPTTWYDKPDIDNLEEYDLIILHNFPFSAADAPVLDKIAEQVKKRNLPLMSFVGQHTNLSAMVSGLGEYLGLVPGASTDAIEEAQVHFSKEYQDHSTFTFDEDWMRVLNNAPPLYRNKSEWRAKGDAKVYATARIKNIQLDYPIYALQEHLGRKNMVFVGENFWRLRAHVMVETGDFDGFDTWLYNNIQWLIVREDRRKFKVRPSKQLFTGNESVTFRGEAYDDSYNPLSGVDIKLTLKNPKGKEEVYYLTESGNARYFLELRNLGEGTYQYSAEGKKNDAVVGTDRGEFSVGRSNIEHFRLQADKSMLEQLALRTEGSFTTAREMDQLGDQILGLSTLKPVVSYLTKRSGLNELEWIFYFLIALLAIEWVVRKRYSLS